MILKKLFRFVHYKISPYLFAEEGYFLVDGQRKSLYLYEHTRLVITAYKLSISHELAFVLNHCVVDVVIEIFSVLCCSNMYTVKTAYFMNIKNILPSMRMWPAWFLTLTLVLFIVPPAGASPEDDVKRIQDAYEYIKDIKGSFIQKSHIKDLERTDTYRGTFFIKQPMKMRWNYEGAESQEVFINDDQIIIYQEKEKQAFRGVFDEVTYGRAPIALLTGFGKIGEEFSVYEKNGILLLKPKEQVSGIKSIEIELCSGEFPICSFTVYDFHENKIVITLKKVKINTGLKDSIFEPALPRDTSFFDHNF